MEHKCLAIVWCIKKMTLLMGTEFCVETVHCSLTFLQQGHLMNPRLSGWSLALQAFKFTVKAVPGTSKSNCFVDVLSRLTK